LLVIGVKQFLFAILTSIHNIFFIATKCNRVGKV